MNIYIYIQYTPISTIKSIKLYQPNKHLLQLSYFWLIFFKFWEPHCLQVIQGHRRPQCNENDRQRPSGVKRWEKNMYWKRCLCSLYYICCIYSLYITYKLYILRILQKDINHKIHVQNKLIVLWLGQRSIHGTSYNAHAEGSSLFSINKPLGAFET